MIDSIHVTYRFIYTMNNEDENLRFKVVFIGNSGVGKTSLINRKIYGRFDYSVAPTVGSAHLTAKEHIGDQTVELCLWDTAGQEKYQSLVPLYLRDAISVVIVASITDHLSLQSIEEWYNITKDQTPNAEVFVVINKIDLPGQNIPSIESLRSDLTGKYQELFFVSAREGEGVNELFFTIAQRSFHAYNESGQITMTTQHIEPEQKKSCC